MGSYNPPVQAPGFGLFRFRSPLLSESRLIYFPPGTEMVHFPGLAHTRLWIQRAVAEVCSAGFPHSEIFGSKPVCGSPKLIAACHVLHRLLAPRHPPHALSSLTLKLTFAVVSLSSSCGEPRVLILLLEQNLRFARHTFTPRTPSSDRSATHSDRANASLFSFQRAAVLLPAEPLRCSSDFTSPPALQNAGVKPALQKATTEIKNPASSAGSNRHTLAAALEARLISSRCPYRSSGTVPKLHPPSGRRRPA